MAKMDDRKKALNAEISKAMMNDFERVGMGFVTYWKPIAAAAIGLAVLIAAICWAAAYQKKSVRTAREALAGAKTAEEIVAALSTYGDSAAAPVARFRLAGIYMQEKKYDEAISQLRQAENASEDPYLAGNIALTEGYALELSGKVGDAAAKFAALAALGTAPGVIRAEARFAAGRLYVMQKELKKAAGLLAAATPDKSLKSVTDYWDEQSASLLRAIESGEYGPFTAESAVL